MICIGGYNGINKHKYATQNIKQLGKRYMLCRGEITCMNGLGDKMNEQEKSLKLAEQQGYEELYDDLTAGC